MDEFLSPPWPVTWPQHQLTDQTLTDDLSCERLAALAGVVTVTGNIRRLTHISAGLRELPALLATLLTAAGAREHDLPGPF